MVRKCDICGKEYNLAKWEYESGKRKYCSKECSSIGFNKKVSGIGKYGGKITCKCEFCGKEFLARRYQVSRGKGKFCSRSCTSKSFKGEKAHNWKNGAVTGVDFIRKSIQYKEWRQKVFIRDRFTCQICNDDTGGNLHAHHIKKLSVLLQECLDYMPLFKIELSAMLYTPLWDISNGRTLCKLCHKQVHKHI
jgi:5-methylcytosine-specific restriction endonuclease McrA